LLLFGSFAGSVSGAAGFASLSELSGDVAKELGKKLGAVKIAMDKSLIRDSISGEPSNLSAYIKNELESAFSAEGFTLVDDIQDSAYFMTVSYHNDGNFLKIFVRYRHSSGDMAYKSISRQIKTGLLPRDALGATLDGKVVRMAGKLQPGIRGMKVFVNPIVESSGKYSCDFSTYLTARLKTQLASAGAQIIDEQPRIASAAGKRSLVLKTGPAQNLAASDAEQAGADAYLEGVFLTDKNDILVSVTIKDNKGKRLAGAEEKFEKSQVTLSAENKTAQKIAVISDVQAEENGDAVKISATRGSRYAVYYEKEKIRFTILVKKPLHVYVFNINSREEVFPLHPGENEPDAPLQPGTLHTIPMGENAWIEVEPPFGTEQVKVFACAKPLPLPRLNAAVASRGFDREGEDRRRTLKRQEAQEALSGQTTIHPNDLVDYFRGRAARQGERLYEDSIFVESRPK